MAALLRRLALGLQLSRWRLSLWIICTGGVADGWFPPEFANTWTALNDLKLRHRVAKAPAGHLVL
jgi:hypothetical protein